MKSLKIRCYWSVNVLVFQVILPPSEILGIFISKVWRASHLLATVTYYHLGFSSKLDKKIITSFCMIYFNIPKIYLYWIFVSNFSFQFQFFEIFIIFNIFGILFKVWPFRLFLSIRITSSYSIGRSKVFDQLAVLPSI